MTRSARVPHVQANDAASAPRGPMELARTWPVATTLERAPRAPFAALVRDANFSCFPRFETHNFLPDPTMPGKLICRHCADRVDAPVSSKGIAE